jgi:hypothetical protein
VELKPIAIWHWKFIKCQVNKMIPVGFFYFLCICKIMRKILMIESDLQNCCKEQLIWIVGSLKIAVD